MAGLLRIWRCREKFTGLALIISGKLMMLYFGIMVGFSEMSERSVKLGYQDMPRCFGFENCGIMWAGLGKQIAKYGRIGQYRGRGR